MKEAAGIDGGNRFWPHTMPLVPHMAWRHERCLGMLPPKAATCTAGGTAGAMSHPPLLLGVFSQRSTPNEAAPLVWV